MSNPYNTGYPPVIPGQPAQQPVQPAQQQQAVQQYIPGQIAAPQAAPSAQDISNLYTPISPEAAARSAHEMQQKGIGQRDGGMFPDIKSYEWREALKRENDHNPRMGENLLYILPPMPGKLMPGVVEWTHYDPYVGAKGRSYPCLSVMFPDRGVPCPYCNTIQSLVSVPGFKADKLAAGAKYAVPVLDCYALNEGVQVARIIARVYNKMVGHLQDANLGENRDFTNPFHALPWRILRLKVPMKRGERVQYDASIYSMVPRPMAVNPDGTADLATIKYWLESRPDLERMLGFPSDERMIEMQQSAAQLYSRFSQPQVQVPGGYYARQPSFAPAQPMYTAPPLQQAPAPFMQQPTAAPAVAAPAVVASPPVAPGAVTQAPFIQQPATVAPPAQQPVAAPPLPSYSAPAPVPAPAVQVSPGFPYAPNPNAGQLIPGMGDMSAPPPQQPNGVPGQYSQQFTPAQAAPPAAAQFPQFQPAVQPQAFPGGMQAGAADQALPPPAPTLPGQPEQAFSCLGQYSAIRIICQNCRKMTECKDMAAKRG